MDRLTNCIIIYDKKLNKYVDKCDEISTIKKDLTRGKYIVTYKNGNSYDYNIENVKWLISPTEINVKNFIIYINGHYTDNINKILLFGSWAKILYKNNTTSIHKYSDIQMVKDHANDTDAKSLISYLKEITAFIGINDDDIKIKSDAFESNDFLLKELTNLCIQESSVLSEIIKHNSTIKRNKFYGRIILPYPADNTQIEAIRNALTHNISVIQGPPGTGKTQTILNLIANLIISGKTVAVAAGNNEAIKNIKEKLDMIGLDMVYALLGNKQNVIDFFEAQKQHKELFQAQEYYPNIDLVKFDQTFNELQKIFSYDTDCTKLNQSIFEFKAEKQNNDIEYAKHQYSVSKSILKKSKKEHYTAKKLLCLAAAIDIIQNKKNLSVFDRIKFIFLFRIFNLKDVVLNAQGNIAYLQNKYYEKFLKELYSELEDKTNILRKFSPEKHIATYCLQSKQILINELIRQFSKIRKFDVNILTYRNIYHKFIQRFPVILSTTHALKYCTGKHYLYDYLIIDESSQVDMASAIVASSCAKNLVLIGDHKQLPNVIKSKFVRPLKTIFEKYNLPVYFEYTSNSILKCITNKYKDLPNTLLRNHYRCDPYIIGFCNKRFYENKLLIKTNHIDGNGIKFYPTPPHFEYERTNKLQAEIIANDILPHLHSESIGIVAPYNAQVKLIRNIVSDKNILIDTVHKFQGKERDVIILTTVSDKIKKYESNEQFDFLNNENLINVAISRAKHKLYIISSELIFKQKNSLLADLINYSAYYFPDSIEIGIRKTYSVFELMYKDYLPVLNKFKKSLLKISKFDSENIIATLLENILSNNKYSRYSYIYEYPLTKILHIFSSMDISDKNFINNSNTHCDFIIFDQIDKSIKCAIEVDGKQHRNDIQKERDIRKDRLLKDAGIPVLRLKTTDTNCKESITSLLDSI